MRQAFENDARSIVEAEETLRQMARLPAPDRLTERVHGRLNQELDRERMTQAVEPERRGFWHLWLPARRIQFAGAALLAAVVVVSTLSVRHKDGKMPQAVVPVPAQSGAFGTGAAQGHPATLKPIPVPPETKASTRTTVQAQNMQGKKKKPSASHPAKRPVKTQETSEAGAASVAP